MDSNDVLIILYDDHNLLRIPSDEAFAEEVCVLAAKRCGIGPLARHLFGLYHRGSETWLSPCDPLKVNLKAHYEFRLRFKLPQVNKLSQIDSRAFNYYFQQVRQDFLNGNIPEIAKMKEQSLGLAVADMLRVKLEKEIPSETIESEYKSYLPQEVKKQYKYFLSRYLKKAMGDALSKLQENKRDVCYVKEQYIQTIFELKPNYGHEEYNVITDEDGRAISVRLQVDPYHPKEPGLKKQVGSKKASWCHVCSIEELCYVSMGKDVNVEISRRNGVPQYFRFQHHAQMRSFVSLLDGYYRLTEKWTFNLCKELPTPSLIWLKSIKCHGPVSQDFAHKKLQSKAENEKGMYLIREHVNEYDSYWIDVLDNGTDSTIVTYPITQTKSNEFKLAEFNQLFSNLHELVNHFTKEKLISTCIPPSEYDKSNLLLCKSANSDYVSMSKDKPTTPVCIHQRSLISIVSSEVLPGKFTTVKRTTWKCRDDRRLDCCLKELKSNYKTSHLEEFLQMANSCVYWHNEAITTMYGYVISPPMILMEYLPLGPLDKYLQNHGNDVEEVDLVEAATYLAKALWYLEEENLCHGNIRCHNVFVSVHIENSFQVKLSDPSLPTYDASQIHWLPPECYSNPKNARNSCSADVWAFGTTLWEIFSYGTKPLVNCSPQQAKEIYLRGSRLPKPKCCDADVYKLMNECWIKDPDARKKPQAIMRDINQTLYEVFNSRRTHQYATVVPRQVEIDTLSSSTFSSSTTDDTMSEAPVTLDWKLHEGINKFFNDFVLNGDDDDGGDNYEFSELITHENSLTPVCQDQEWLIERCQLELGQKLGQGFYGEVQKAFLARWSGLEREDVAIKQLKSGMGSGLHDLLQEITIMKTLHHKNIVEIKGVVEDPEMLLVMEFVPLGSLLVYLRTYKERLSEKQLLKFATDIAEGMEYLGEKRIVHRDLAARNVLVASHDLVKISDFGLAQMMGAKDYYRLKTIRDLPIRWYAPETLRHWCFTHKSDVWSFGVTLWEMFSYGQEPVIEGCKDEDLLSALERGTRLCCPNEFSVSIYRDFMRRCWDADPDERPTFSELVLELEKLQ